ncbi:MAG TPA: ABC transporter ATP-binding protein [Arenicellales bacterium]|nr:ABC transporter ATP-binding protein [Arenicellales bacterium]
MAVLEVRECYAGYGEAEILHGVNLSVEKNEFVTIIGPNGAGKSTLIKMVMGFLTPSSGSILFEDRDISGLRTDERVSAGIAYVPQLDNVFPSLTVTENLRMGGYLLPASEISRRIEEQFAQFPRLAERRRQRVSTMSGGERQMLAMARALMTNPSLLLLDEPSAALSPAMVDQVFETVTGINRQGRTIVIVEQEARIALSHSHRGYVLADGRNVLDDRADRILADEKVREAYLGGTAQD